MTYFGVVAEDRGWDGPFRVASAHAVFQCRSNGETFSAPNCSDWPDDMQPELFSKLALLSYSALALQSSVMGIDRETIDAQEIDEVLRQCHP